MKTNSKKCECSVDSLIQNQATKFTEEDREWLAELSQDQLEKLAPPEPEEKVPAVSKKAAVVVNKAEEAEASLVTKGEDGSININGKPIGEYIKEELAKESDPLKFIDNVFPDGLKDQMKSGLKMYQNRRAKQIKEIAANSKFKEAQLKSWSDEDLTSLHETLVSEDEENGGNYAPLANGNHNNGGDDEEGSEGSEDEIAAMMSFGTAKSKEKETAKK